MPTSQKGIGFFSPKFHTYTSASYQDKQEVKGENLTTIIAYNSDRLNVQHEIYKECVRLIR